MPKLPVVAGRRVVKVLQKAGWHQIRVGSSRHIILQRPGETVTLSVPDHRQIDRGLLRALIRDARLTVEEFVRLLR